MCLFYRQNGEDGPLQEEEGLIPQQFNIRLWIWQKTCQKRFQSEKDSSSGRHRSIQNPCISHETIVRHNIVARVVVEKYSLF
jgi:hypothetical protein